MRVAMMLVGAVAGCSFAPQTVVGDAPRDAHPDAPADGPPDADLSVCSGAGLACPGGQLPRAITCGNTDCWYGCRDGPQVTEPQAAALCAAWSGKLARIDSAAEMTCMRTVLDGAVWIGLEQASGQVTTVTGWTWNNDGVVPAYLDWAAGQPNDADGIEDGTEQCAYSSTSATWQDTACTSVMSRFSCRR